MNRFHHDFNTSPSESRENFRPLARATEEWYRISTGTLGQLLIGEAQCVHSSRPLNHIVMAQCMLCSVRVCREEDAMADVVSSARGSRRAMQRAA
eukprot:COSAG02_NODE_4018_length_5900_cov_6.102741_2_plen_95_part_00